MNKTYRHLENHSNILTYIIKTFKITVRGLTWMDNQEVTLVIWRPELLKL